MSVYRVKKFGFAILATSLGVVSGLAPRFAWAALNIPLTVTMSEAVTVDTAGGTPRIPVDVGGTTRYASYSSGSGTNTLTFTLSPTAGDVDLDGIAVSSPVDLNGGAIRDVSGNAATLTFTPPNTAGIKVDYPSLGMDFVYDADGRYTLNGVVYNDLPSLLTAAGGSFTRASIGTYYDSTGTLQTAAAGVPRFDYDPVTHVAKGLLIEESRTNLLPQSQIDSLWMSGGTTPPTVSNSQTYLGIPCAAVTFTSANTSTGYAGSRATRTGTGAPYAAITVGIQYSSSMYVSLSRALTGSESIGVYFTGSNGLGLTLLNSTNSSGYVGQWSRTANAPVTAVATGNDYPTTFLNSVVSSPVTIYLSRGQVEVGAFPTSYIPTGASTLTRAADVMIVPYSLSASPVSAMADFEKEGAINNDRVFTIDDGTSNNFTQVVLGSSLIPSVQITTGAVSQAYVTGSAVSLNQNVKLSMRAASNNARLSQNGVLSSLDNSVTLPSGLSTLRIGHRVGPGEFLMGRLRMLKVYNNALSDAQLQLLSQ